MPLHDYECSECGSVNEHFVNGNVHTVRCLNCKGDAHRIFLTVAKPHWSALAMGSSASPEAIARFDRVHRQQKEKEEKSYKENGDYGPAPGGDGGRSYTGE